MRSALVPLSFIAALVFGAVVGCTCGDDRGGDGQNDGGDGQNDGGGSQNDGGDGQNDAGGGQNDGGGENDGGGGQNDGGDGGDGGQDGGGGQNDGGGGNSICTPVSCGGQTYLCGNCLDDDNDGLVDDKDPQCLGPCHNREDSFLWGLAPADQGGAGQCQRDCYFDGNASVASTDHCQYNLKCDPKTPDSNCSYDSSLVGSSDCPATQSHPDCYGICRDQLTPNGCDCWGCCSVTKNGVSHDVYLRSQNINGTGTACTIQTSDDPAVCMLCTKNLSCQKECGTCQLCLGKTELPASCLTADGGVDPGLQCPGGEQACGLPGQPDCPEGLFCLTGCCKEIIIN
jgi:hypothetical protein